MSIGLIAAEQVDADMTVDDHRKLAGEEEPQPKPEPTRPILPIQQ